jgi:hypothetical protein
MIHAILHQVRNPMYAAVPAFFAFIAIEAVAYRVRSPRCAWPLVTRRWVACRLLFRQLQDDSGRFA